tara:strand:- start:588 stop:1616 length:1029 start_codon:yes stop_codon:yes gene_type:complete
MKRILILSLILTNFLGCTNSKKDSDVVNVYTKRHYQVDKDLFESFEKEFGIKVNVVKASADELIERIKTEGENGPADLIITVDAGKLYKAANEDLLQNIDANEFCSNINPNLIDVNNYWLPITYRSRVVVYHKERVDPSDLSTYDDLTSSKWKNRLLVRTSTNSYNQALMSSIIAHKGEKYALDWSNRIVENFAREPKGNDRDQVRAISANVGDIAIVNSYYIGLLMSSEDSLDRMVGESVNVFFPNQGADQTGAHVNISGIGLLKTAPNLNNAKKLMKYLTSEYAQNYYTNNSFEYPVNTNVEPSTILAEWGGFKIDNLDLNKLGVFRKKAVQIFEKSNWQ